MDIFSILTILFAVGAIGYSLYLSIKHVMKRRKEYSRLRLLAMCVLWLAEIYLTGCIIKLIIDLTIKK